MKMNEWRNDWNVELSSLSPVIMRLVYIVAAVVFSGLVN